MTGLTHRPASDADVPLLAALNQQLIEDEGAETALDRAGLEARLRGWLSGAYRAVVFEVESRPVGYALFRPDEDGFYLRHFLIERGERRKGFGRGAVAILLERVFPLGIRIALEVLDGNPAGLAFWRAVGFRERARTLVLHT
jgi:GNAT superfamily N-acetyltransferase